MAICFTPTIHVDWQSVVSLYPFNTPAVATTSLATTSLANSVTSTTTVLSIQTLTMPPFNTTLSETMADYDRGLDAMQSTLCLAIYLVPCNLPCAMQSTLCHAIYLVPCNLPCAMQSTLCLAIYLVPCNLPCAMQSTLCHAIYLVPCNLPCALHSLSVGVSKAHCCKNYHLNKSSYGIQISRNGWDRHMLGANLATHNCLEYYLIYSTFILPSVGQQLSPQSITHTQHY